MREFKILVCEDLEKDIRDIKLYLNSLKDKINGVTISYVIANFTTVYQELNNHFDFLILDLYDEKKGYLGDNVLIHNVHNIQTIVYTSTGDTVGFEIEEMKIRFPFLLDKLTKSHSGGDNLKGYIKQYILGLNISEPYYCLYNENDMLLINSVITIGERNFNDIIYQIAEKTKFVGKIIVYRMTSGLSGAILFKLEINGQYSILKLSREIEKLKIEHQNSIELYHKFPNRLINHIDSEEYYSYNFTVLGILLKEIDNSITLFDFLIDAATSKDNIEKFLTDLFIDDQGLKNHYKTHKKGQGDWTTIFNKINESKFILIQMSYNSLKPLVIKFYREFEIEDFRRLTINHDFGKLNKKNLLDKKYFKELMLSHGDLHSKNILVQSGFHPVIIDTGSLSYQFWSVDICRLIVHLFIEGLDYGQYEFFDLERINRYIENLNKLIEGKELDFDGLNDNIYAAINWLSSNLTNIYKKEFELFEFQLGLMKEFLQVSYRFDTIPPNKRAFALIAAHKCMITANENIKK
jgi:hypothetical protein